MSCNKCHQQNCCCPPPCLDCGERETIIVRCAPKRNICEQLFDQLREIVGYKPKCLLALAQPIISGNIVTLIALNGDGTLEYSKDGEFWTLSPTFTLPNGQHRLYVRQANQMACIRNIVVNINATCIPHWVDVYPESRECRDNKYYIRTTDGCGNFDWRDTGLLCNIGPCIPNWVDVVPELKECFNGFERIRTHNSCGEFSWRTTTTACNGGCVPNWVDVVPQITECQGETKRIRTTDGCGNFDWRDAGACDCVTPTFTVSKVDPTCNGTAGANGKLVLSNYQHATRVQVCPDSTFTCAPNFAGATLINGTGPIDIITGISFLADQQYKDYTVRVYFASQQCFNDATFRFTNPCFVVPGCELPYYTGIIANPATCVDSVIQNNASVQLTNVGETTRFGYSIGTVYSGPNYASAVQLSGAQIQIINLPGQTTIMPIVIRQFNGSDDCFQDVPVNVPAPVCDGECENPPTFTNKFATEATCSGNTLNNDAKITISGIAGIFKYGYSQGSTYTGPDYAGATDFTGNTIELSNLPGSQSDTPYTFRLYHGIECYTTLTQVIPGKTCSVDCVKPTFDLEYTAPTCNGTESNNDGQLRIVNHTNGNKFQLCLDAGWTCTPNYDGAYPITGNGTVIALSDIGFFTNQEYRDFFVRVYNDSETCYETKSVRIQNPCLGTCCSLQILSVTLIND